jgi:hypothetical protein
MCRRMPHGSIDVATERRLSIEQAHRADSRQPHFVKSRARSQLMRNTFYGLEVTEIAVPATPVLPLRPGEPGLSLRALPGGIAARGLALLALSLTLVGSSG